LKSPKFIDGFGQGHPRAMSAMIWSFPYHLGGFLSSMSGRLGIVLPQPHGGRQNVLVNK
jgi:hypothetical protein